MGWVLQPVFKDLLGDSNGTRRRLVLTAAGLGGGVKGEEFVLAHLTKRRSIPDSEIVVGLVTLALSEGRNPDDLDLGAIQERGDVVFRVAAGLAMRRFGDAVAPDRWFLDPDPGVVAVAFACGTRGHEQDLATWRRDRPHAEIVRRGYMLGDADGPSTETELALALAALSNSATEQGASRRAAALYLTRIKDANQLVMALKGKAPRPELIPILATDPTIRALLIARAWLGPVPPRRLAQDDRLIRPRHAVAYALGRELSGIRSEAKVWGGDSGVAPALCLALACRLFRDPKEAGGKAARELLASLPDIPEAEWVRMAISGEVQDRVSDEDPYLGKAFAFARSGRLPDAQKVEVLECALWRRGWHLGQFAVDAQQDLVFALILAGAVVDQSGRDTKAYFPGGLSPEHLCFRELRGFLEFLRVPGPRVPAGSHLRY